MFKHIFVVVLFAVMTVACVNTGTVKLNSEQSTVLTGKSLASSTSEKPNFIAETPGKAMFALVGVLAMISAGNEIVEKYDIQDPAISISLDIAKVLAEEKKMNLVETPQLSSKDDSIDYLASIYMNHDYLLDVRTIGWKFGHIAEFKLLPSFDEYLYRISYSAKARLIDLHDKKVIAEAFCNRMPDESSETFSYEQLIDNNALGLKRELQIVADDCTEEFSNKLL